MNATTTKAPATKKAPAAKKTSAAPDVLDALDFAGAAQQEVFRDTGSYFAFNTSERGTGAPAVINNATLPGTDIRMTQVRVPFQFEERLKRLGMGNFTVLIMALADAKLAELEAAGNVTLQVTNKAPK